MYFIDTDLNSNFVYVIPMQQIAGREYVIECKNLYEAQSLKTDLTVGRLRMPIKNEEEFELVREFEKFGKTLNVYKRKGA